MPAAAIGSGRTFRYDAVSISESSPACTAPLPARSKSPSNRTSCRNARRSKNREYFWSYTIVITNSGDETVQLRTRHWIITDASGRKQEVRGEGVVGEQPVLAPGERFEYTSGVPLPTASGFMTGRYQMVSESGERFEIDVPTFSLDSPDSKRVLN